MHDFQKSLLTQLQKPLQKGQRVFIAPGAHVIGDVHLEDDSNIWFGAVLRGDTAKLNVGKRTNIQDNAVLHADPGEPCIIGHDCVVGHGAIVHGALLDHHVLVGMHATILNRAKIGAYSIIGANALVPSDMEIPPYSLVLGVPGKIVKTLSKDISETIQNNVDEYVKRAQVYIQFYNEIKD
jgi:carbonic anhydrase/acetyltransferase-like protein (isoleucine patch superfamily)